MTLDGFLGPKILHSERPSSDTLSGFCLRCCTAMKLGVAIFPTEYTISITELARAAEAEGFDSLWLPEHTHIPVSRLTPYPGGGDLPREYSHLLDPFVALSAAAAVTTTLKLGAGVCLVIERDPIVTAKAAASLDLVSGGRLLFGVGGGWNREEMLHHGTDPHRRWKVLRERVEAMKALWTQDEAEYHGEFVDFGPSWSWPKPAQKPHPPICVGGNGPNSLKRVIAYGDAWIPIAGRGAASLPERITELAQLAAEAGRPPIPVSVFTAGPNREKLDELAALGVERVIIWLPPAGPQDVLPRLKRYAALAV